MMLGQPFCLAEQYFNVLLRTAIIPSPVCSKMSEAHHMYHINRVEVCINKIMSETP